MSQQIYAERAARLRAALDEVDAALAVTPKEQQGALLAHRASLLRTHRWYETRSNPKRQVIEGQPEPAPAEASTPDPAPEDAPEPEEGAPIRKIEPLGVAVNEEVNLLDRS